MAQINHWLHLCDEHDDGPKCVEREYRAVLTTEDDAGADAMEVRAEAVEALFRKSATLEGFEVELAMARARREYFKRQRESMEAKLVGLRALKKRQSRSEPKRKDDVVDEERAPKRMRSS